MELQELFHVVAERMRNDLKLTRIALTHPGLKGSAFEDLFRNFLRMYLPKSLDIVTGILVDSEGRQSRQLDVIICDAQKTPVFYAIGETRVIPIECAYMVIEVKANLDSDALWSCFENMKSVKQLQKKAYLQNNGVIISTVNLYGQDWPIWPINYFVFAYDSISIEAIVSLTRIRIDQEQLPLHSRIDTICVLDRGVIFNQGTDGNYDALPSPGSVLTGLKTKDSLLLFYTLLSRYTNQTQLPHFRFLDYISQMQFSNDA